MDDQFAIDHHGSDLRPCGSGVFRICVGHRRPFVEGSDVDRERLSDTRIDAAVRDPAVVVNLNGDNRRAERSSGGREGQRPVGRNRGLSGEETLIVVADDEIHRLHLVRPRADAGREVQERLSRRVDQHIQIRADRETRRIVDRRDRDRESLSRTDFDSAVGRATVVVDQYRDGRSSVLIRRQRVGQRSGWRDRRLHQEQRVVVVRDLEIDGLSGIIRAGADVGRPVGDGLCSGIFQHRLVRPFGEAGSVVDSGDRDGEGFSVSGIVTAIRGPTVVADCHRDGCCPICVRRWSVSQRACGRDRGLSAKQR